MKKYILGGALLLAVLGLSACPAECQAKNVDSSSLESLPVQHEGRVKPFSSFALETVISVIEKASYQGLSPSKLVLEWMAYPEVWGNKPLLKVRDESIRSEIGLQSKDHRISPKDLLASGQLVEDVFSIRRNQSRGEALTHLEKQKYSLYEQAETFYRVTNGQLLKIIAPLHARSSHEAWLSLDEASRAADLAPYQAAFQKILDAYRKQSQRELDTAVKEFKGLSEANPAYISFLTQKTFLGSAFELEVTFNQLHPFRWASWAYFAALILFSIALFRPSVKWVGWFGRGAFLAGFLLHTYGILLRSLIAGRPPVSNMYESVIWVAWAAVLFSLILYFFYRNPVIWPATALLASLTLYLVQNIPAFLDPAITPLVPVLRSNYWLTIHVLTITLSYGAFALAMIVGHVLLFLFAFKPSDKALIESIGAWLYRLIQIGVILLASGTILGGVWAHYSWGRFWGWDPKETWALIALIGYLIILHMRLVQWIGPLGLAVGSIVAFLGVLMAWYGVNFVLAAGLHSYGFGGGGVAYVAAFIALDLAVVGALAWKIKTQKAI